MNIEQQSHITSQILHEYLKTGYTQSVRSKILMFRSSDNFAEFVTGFAYKNIELFKKIIMEKQVKLTYAQVVANLPIEYRYEWAIRNGVNGMGPDEKKVIEDMAFRQNLVWAFRQYSKLYDELRYDKTYPGIDNPYRKASKSREITRLQYSENLTAKEIFERTLKTRPTAVEDVIDQESQGYKLIVSDELVDIVLANNPTEGVVSLLLSQTEQSAKSRGKLLEKFAEVTSRPLGIMGFLDTERRRLDDAREPDWDTPLDTLYQDYNLYASNLESVNRAMVTAFGRKDYFDGFFFQDSKHISDELRKGVYKYAGNEKQFSGEALKALAKNAFETLKERDALKPELRTWLLYGRDNVIKIMREAFKDAITPEEIDKLVKMPSFDRESIITGLVQTYGDSPEVEEHLKVWEDRDAELNNLLLNIKAQKLQEASAGADE